MIQKVIDILLIEDDVLDQIEVKRTLDRKNIVYRLMIAKNGEEAIRALEGKIETVFSGIPDIILLDLNMPKMNGFEFLTLFRSHDEWKGIKLFVLTTSEESVDKNEAMNFGVSGFITKPLKLESPSSKDAFNLMIDIMNI